jgi:uncharacterized protein (DUF1330 family)
MSSIFRGIIVGLVAASLVIESTAFHVASSMPWSVRHGDSTSTRLFDTFQKDSFDMDELRQRIRAEQTKPYSNIALQTSILNVHPTIQQPKVETVYIVSFQKCGGVHGGIQRRGGVHSIEYPKGSGNNVILAFASRDACEKFAESLRAQHFFDPTVRTVGRHSVAEFGT